MHRSGGVTGPGLGSSSRVSNSRPRIPNTGQGLPNASRGQPECYQYERAPLKSPVAG